MKTISIILSLFFSWSVISQENLNLETVISRTLASNFNIQLIKNDYSIAQNNNNIGAAGYLPSVSLTSDQLWSTSNTRQEFFSGQVNEKNGAKNTAFSSGVRLDWTLFDGFGMFIRDKRLQLQEDYAESNLRAQMEMTIYQVSALYTSIYLNEQMLAVYEGAIQLSNARLEQLTLKKNNGAANNLDWLQARMDVSADSSILLTYQTALLRQKKDLAFYMGDSTGVNYVLAPIQLSTNTFDYTSQLNLALDQNSELLLQKSMIAITDQQKKEAQSKYYPQLSLYAQGTFNRSQSQVGLLSSNRSLGPGVGLSLTWNILDGLSRVTEIKNLKIAQQSNDIRVQQQKQLIRVEFDKVFADYQNAKTLYAMEARNAVSTEEMIAIAQKSFENGAITQLQLREFQYSLVDAKNRQLNAELSLQTALLNLQILTGHFKTLVP